MRDWFIRLRTAFAALAVVLLLWQFPAAWARITAPRQNLLGEPAQTCVLRVWVQESWTGTGMQWVTNRAAAFEKAYQGTRVVIRRAQAGDWLLSGAVPPDLLLFEAGAVKDPETLLAPITKPYEARAPLLSVGAWRGKTYAVPLCYGGYVRLTNGSETGGPDLFMKSEKEYQAFAAQQAHSLIATIREARRLSALQAAGKGFAFSAEPYGTHTDKILMAGRTASVGIRAERAGQFVDFLLSADAQNALPALGLLPAAPYADPPDEAEQPLLLALSQSIETAVNAFD